MRKSTTRTTGVHLINVEDIDVAHRESVSKLLSVRRCVDRNTELASAVATSVHKPTPTLGNVELVIEPTATCVLSGEHETVFDLSVTVSAPDFGNTADVPLDVAILLDCGDPNSRRTCSAIANGIFRKLDQSARVCIVYTRDVPHYHLMCTDLQHTDAIYHYKTLCIVCHSYSAVARNGVRDYQEALNKCASILGKSEPTRRKAIIAVTDGVNDTAVGAMLKSEVPVHIVTVGSRVAATLGDVAELSGGNCTTIKYGNTKCPEFERDIEMIIRACTRIVAHDIRVTVDSMSCRNVSITTSLPVIQKYTGSKAYPQTQPLKYNEDGTAPDGTVIIGAMRAGSSRTIVFTVRSYPTISSTSVDVELNFITSDLRLDYNRVIVSLPHPKTDSIGNLVRYDLAVLKKTAGFKIGVLRERLRRQELIAASTIECYSKL